MAVAPRRFVYLRLMGRALKPQRGESWFANAAWALALFIVVLAGWQLAVRLFRIPDIVLPSPSDIAEYLIRRDQLFVKHLWPTLLQTIEGFALAVIGGVTLAIIVSLSAFGRRAIMPLLVVAQIVPKIAVAPLFMLWFGLGDLARVLIAFTVASLSDGD